MNPTHNYAPGPTKDFLVTLTVTEIWVWPGWIGTEAFGAEALPPPPIP